MRLHTLFTLFSLIAPVALVTAVDPTSIPVLVRTFTLDCTTEIFPKEGLVMSRSNHPCYSLPYQNATESTDHRYYTSTLVSGNFTLTAYNMYHDEISDFGACNTTYSTEKNLLKIYTNIELRKCVPGLGHSFDWAPVNVYIGAFKYGGGYDDPNNERASCNDTFTLKQSNEYGNVATVGTCNNINNPKDQFIRTKHVEWGNGTFSFCSYTDALCSSTEPLNRTCETEIFNTCIPAEKSNSTQSFYTVKFGGIIPTTQTPTTPVPTTPVPTTPAPTNKGNTTTSPPTSPTSTPAAPTLKPKSDASCTSSTSIFTIMATMAIAFVTRI